MNRNKRLVIGTVVIALAAAACGSSSKGASTTTSSVAGGKKFSGSITLAVNPWDGSAANAAVAKVILEKEGTTVKLKDIDENAVWAALDSDTIDANLEVWPSGHAKDIETYITTKKSVVDAPLLLLPHAAAVSAMTMVPMTSRLLRFMLSPFDREVWFCWHVWLAVALDVRRRREPPQPTLG